MAHVSTIITRLRRGLAKNYKCPKGWRLSQVFLIYFILQLLKQHSESNQRRPKKKEKSQQVRMGPLHPADSQSHAGYTNFKAAWRHLQNSIFTNSVIFFFFFPERLFQPAVSTLTIPVLNPLQGGIHLLDNPTRSDFSQLGLLCMP